MFIRYRVPLCNFMITHKKMDNIQKLRGNFIGNVRDPPVASLIFQLQYLPIETL